MKQLIFLLAVTITAIFSSCEKYEITEYAGINDTNDSVTVILIEKKGYSIIHLLPEQTRTFYVEGSNIGGHSNPFDAETHFVYKGKEYVENSLTGNSIRHKDAYKYDDTYKDKKGSVNYYYFHITEEYILSLPEMPKTEY